MTTSKQLSFFPAINFCAVVFTRAWCILYVLSCVTVSTNSTYLKHWLNSHNFSLILFSRTVNLIEDRSKRIFAKWLCTSYLT